jgi:hypothetical protein
VVVRVRGENRSRRTPRRLHRCCRPVVHRDEAAQPDWRSVCAMSVIMNHA